MEDAIAAAYALPPIRTCERFDRESSSVVRIEAGRVYWLKLADRGLAAMETEADVASQLGDLVAAPVRRRDGRYAGMIDAMPALLFHEAPGVEVQVPTRAQAEALGALLAQLHATSVRADLWRIDADSLGRRPLRAMAPWLDTRRLEPLVEEMAAFVDGLPIGLCHGDVHLENMRFDGDRPTLFDLESCGIGPCAYDHACYWRKHGELLCALSPAEQRAIPALATLRAVWVMAMPIGTSWGQDWLLDPEYVEAHVAMIEGFGANAAR